MIKSENAFKNISEVSEYLDIPTHVLRFWETQFIQIKPIKRVGGRRYYRPEDVELLARIRDCLYKEGYTIKGVQKLLKAHSLPKETPAEDFDSQKVANFVTEMKEAREMLKSLLD